MNWTEFLIAVALYLTLGWTLGLLYSQYVWKLNPQKVEDFQSVLAMSLIWAFVWPISLVLLGLYYGIWLLTEAYDRWSRALHRYLYGGI